MSCEHNYFQPNKKNLMIFFFGIKKVLQFDLNVKERKIMGRFAS